MGHPTVGAALVEVEPFRDAMSRIPAPVGVVAVFDDARPHGTTVSAFCSLSASPPMVLVSLSRSSDLLTIVRETSRFSLNLLASGQEAIAVACAHKGVDKFRAIPWKAELGLPRILDCSAWLACTVDSEHDGGDHVVIQGLVTHCDVGEFPSLYYYRRQFLASPHPTAA